MDIILNELPDTDIKDNEWKYKENLDLFNKYSQFNKIKDEIIKEEIKKDIILKDKKPLEVIMSYTSTADMMKNVIKDKLIEFITVPEFSKAFGVKKSSEIVSAITRNAWNQSVALFISFLLDATVIYKDKPYIFNKNKIINEILI
jgi:hypothetical protein